MSFAAPDDNRHDSSAASSRMARRHSWPAAAVLTFALPAPSRGLHSVTYYRRCHRMHRITARQAPSREKMRARVAASFDREVGNAARGTVTAKVEPCPASDRTRSLMTEQCGQSAPRSRGPRPRPCPGLRMGQSGETPEKTASRHVFGNPGPGNRAPASFQPVATPRQGRSGRPTRRGL